MKNQIEFDSSIDRPSIFNCIFLSIWNIRFIFISIFVEETKRSLSIELKNSINNCDYREREQHEVHCKVWTTTRDDSFETTKKIHKVKRKRTEKKGNDDKLKLCSWTTNNVWLLLLEFDDRDDMIMSFDWVVSTYYLFRLHHDTLKCQMISSASCHFLLLCLHLFSFSSFFPCIFLSFNKSHWRSWSDRSVCL